MRSVLTLALLSTVSAISACAPEGSSAYVTFNIPPDDTCLYTPTATLFTPIGQYDVGDGGHAPNCRHSYFMNLLVNSNLKSNARAATGRAEPNVLQIMEADVRLMNKNQETLNCPCKKDSTDESRWTLPQGARSIRRIRSAFRRPIRCFPRPPLSLRRAWLRSKPFPRRTRRI